MRRMSAKPSKKSGRKDPAPVSARSESIAPASVAPTAAVPAAGAIAATADPAWIESSDPRKRAIGKAVLVGVWIYVAALWLLALDQTFHWGIFGPKAPPLP